MESTKSFTEECTKTMANTDKPKESDIRLGPDSLPPTINLGSAEGTPISADESPVKNYNQIFQSLPECALIIDLKGIVQGANRVFQLTTGFAPDEIIGHHLSDFVLTNENTQEDTDTHREIERFIINSIVDDNSLYNYELNYKNRNNDPIPISFSGSPIQNEDGNIVGIVGIGRDMTETRRLISSLEKSQEIIEEYNRSLEMKMADRMEEVRQRSRILEEMSITDELTKLYNRRYLFKRLSEEIQRSIRYGQPFSLVLLDIDWFKRINDTYGHLAGDMVLYELAGILRGSVRQVDVVARTGGEEFIILLPSIREGHAYIFCERLREKVKAFQFTYLPDDIFISVSMGVADFPNPDIHDSDSLIQAADKALYQAKETRDTTILSSSVKESPLVE